MEYFCGLDFGTTNSVMTLSWTDGAGTARTETLMEPSVMFFPSGSKTGTERYVGQEAIEQYLASGMNGRFFQSVKTLLPDPDFLFTRVNGKAMKVEDLVAVVIRYLRTRMEERCGFALSTVVLGRPARFSTLPERDTLAQERLERAARQAGFSQIVCELEPIAAAYAYERTVGTPQLVLVGDFGGGTSDFTLMRVDPAKVGQSDRASDILGTGGVYVGGDAFDADIMATRIVHRFGANATYESYGKHLRVPQHLFRTICRWDQIHFLKTLKYKEEIRTMLPGSSDRAGIERLIALIEHDRAYGLTKAIQRSKHHIADHEQSLIAYKTPEFSIAETLTRQNFNQAIAENVTSIKTCVDEVLAQAKLGEADIAAVFLTGGSSRVGLIRELFTRRFGLDKVHIDSDQFVSIAHGLCLKARELGAVRAVPA